MAAVSTAATATATTTSTSTSTVRELVISRAFDAPRQLVFKAWTEPERLVRWWGPRGFTLPVCKMELRPGGAYRFCMRSAEGTDHWLQGVYREVVEPERLVFTWAWEDAEGQLGPETVVTVTFVEQGDRTRLVVHHARFETDSARDAHQEGWTSCIERLAEYLAAA